MSFCPVCGDDEPGAARSRCGLVAAHYGFDAPALAAIASRGASIPVPFFDVRRLLFALGRQAHDPLAAAMHDAVVRAGVVPAREFGNAVTVVPFASSLLPACRALFVKHDVSKAMVVYQHDDELEHLGAEERAALFAELARDWCGLGEVVPPTTWGLLPSGALFVASASAPPDFVPLSRAGAAALEVARAGPLVDRLAVLDFVLGQNDRNAENVLVSPRGEVALIDNDASFATERRLLTPFAYLAADERGLAPGHAWTAALRLSDLVARLAPLALPAPVLAALAARFAFARRAVRDQASLSVFLRAGFRTAHERDLPPVAWAACHTLVLEVPGLTRHRTIVGEAVDDGFEVTVLEGAWLVPGVRRVGVAKVDTRDAAERAVASLAAAAAVAGYSELLRRRFFVSSGEQTAIIEVHGGVTHEVVTKRGEPGHYGARRRASASFDTTTDALAHARQLENELLAAGFVDLRARLETFRAPPPPTLF